MMMTPAATAGIELAAVMAAKEMARESGIILRIPMIEETTEDARKK